MGVEGYGATVLTSRAARPDAGRRAPADQLAPSIPATLGGMTLIERRLEARRSGNPESAGPQMPRAPLARVFARTWQSDQPRDVEVAGVTALRRAPDTIFADHSLSILRRIVGDRGRVEEGRPTHTAIVRSAAPASPVAPLVGDAGIGAPDGRSMAWVRAGAAPSDLIVGPGMSTAVPPGVDVQQLADQVMHQIDRRLVAYRERMGKSF
jgi:hypothetical protein